MSIFAENKNKIMGLFGLFSNKKKETLDKGLEKTKESVFGKLARAVAGKSTVDDDVLDGRVKGAVQRQPLEAGAQCADGELAEVRLCACGCQRQSVQ